MNIYTELTGEFNCGQLRVIISSGQAVVVHRLAIMSKDGDWIVREDPGALKYIRSVLEQRGARYRFGAPLDVRWLSEGWSSHFQFDLEGLRVRTDFVTRPPRLSPRRLEAIWREQEQATLPVVNPADLAELKKTNREKDYAVIGELARIMGNESDRLRYSRSARDILEIYGRDTDMSRNVLAERAITEDDLQSIETLEAALDSERRCLIHANEDRLRGYLQASVQWSGAWRDLERTCSRLPLGGAHELLIEEAEKLLPFAPAQGNADG